MRHFLGLRIDGRAPALVLTALLGSTAACGGPHAHEATTAWPSEPACRLEIVQTVPVTADADPEGITSAGGRLFVSALDGAVLAGTAADTGATLALLSRPTTSRTAAGGLRAVGDLLVLAGLSARVVDVVDAATGDILSSQPTPDDALPNDVVVQKGTLYVSDTQGDRVFAAPLGADGRLGSLTEFADVSGAVDRANGMTLTPDAGALLVVGTSRGLARVDLGTGAVTAVEGGDTVYGDGLYLVGGRLFTSINWFVTVLDVEPDGSAVRLRGRVEIDAPARLATLTSDGDDLLVLASGLRYTRRSENNAVLRLDTAGCP